MAFVPSFVLEFSLRRQDIIIPYLRFERATAPTAEVMMIRNAFKMKLKPGNEAEYKRRHDDIWPELSRQLEAAGVSDYSIYLDPETLTLFAFQKLADDHTAHNLPQTKIVQEWWAHMADLMDVNPDNSPVVVPLEEVFHMD